MDNKQAIAASLDWSQAPAQSQDGLAAGLKIDEYERIVTALGRVPNQTELGIFSVMWSEHCSYKSSRKHLSKLPTTGPNVICGPGENAGVIDIGDGDAVVFKIESHNHPSFIEPFQGAATGVGGIMRDVFTMGARPVANLNALRFGDPSHPKTKHLVAGVVAGIGGYGNCMGVPTVGGETEFDPAYNGNILVNAMTVGLARADRIFYSAAGGVGNQVVYVGAKTGRDGIHGATMASAEFSEDSESKRPTVQVGDPFKEKLLLEACLELMATDAIVAIQDMGAAGLTSSSVEMASKGGCGIRLNLDLVPLREDGMTAYEIMLSESQERMLMILKPESEALAAAIFAKWELDFAVIGEITDSGNLELIRHGTRVCALPLSPLVDAAPLYDRPFVIAEPAAEFDDSTIAPTHPDSLLRDLKTLLARPNFASRRWIWQQYDHLVGGQTVIPPGGDAAVIRLTRDHVDMKKGLALSVDCNPHYCFSEPRRGGAYAVLEVWRNITAVGGRLQALTNNLNFGNPEKPEIMGQLVGCLEGMAEACRALSVPIVSGNVSLYNETNGEAILPTPVVGGVGLVDDVSKAVTIGFKSAGDLILLLPATRTDLFLNQKTSSLGTSAYRREVMGLANQGRPPAINYSLELATAAWLGQMMKEQRISACHDVGSGGLLVALAEMAMKGNLGAAVTLPAAIAPLVAGFGEGLWSYLLTASPTDAEAIMAAANTQGITIFTLGKVTAAAELKVENHGTISLSELRAGYDSFLPNLMQN
ncbi:MAG: phosphoribosylformylglycinamidine synthase subunit PurL [Candidatus Pacebacteria bacterium]|nr:phosphoribosylformylglycinamidine synthase subunit PurL [Candidatus Paceibacterota bacterium]